MTRAEMIALASPPCHECGEPVQRVESGWHFDEDNCWRLVMVMVCAEAHRVIVEPIYA